MYLFCRFHRSPWVKFHACEISSQITRVPKSHEKNYKWNYAMCYTAKKGNQTSPFNYRPSHLSETRAMNAIFSAYTKTWTGRWTVDNGRWTMDNGQWTMDLSMVTQLITSWRHELNTRPTRHFLLSIFYFYNCITQSITSWLPRHQISISTGHGDYFIYLQYMYLLGLARQRKSISSV